MFSFLIMCFTLSWLLVSFSAHVKCLHNDTIQNILFIVIYLCT